MNNKSDLIKLGCWSQLKDNRIYLFYFFYVYGIVFTFKFVSERI